MGDTVETKFRGGKRTGQVSSVSRISKHDRELLRPLSKVEAVIENEQDLKEQGDTLNVSVKNPPKVVFTDQVSAPCRDWDETKDTDNTLGVS